MNKLKIKLLKMVLLCQLLVKPGNILLVITPCLSCLPINCCSVSHDELKLILVFFHPL
jgi:hypothetical protein